MRILLIEDSKADAFVNMHSIKSEYPEAEFAWARGATEAKRMIAPDDITFDLVLVDRHLPDAIGTELADCLSTARSTQDSTKVMITYDATDEARADALAKDFDGYLTKPVSCARLRRIVADGAASWEIGDLPRRLSTYYEQRQSLAS